jgi:hypothetical protein
MAKKRIMLGMLALALTFGFVIAGCATTGGAYQTTAGQATGLSVEEALRKYMAPEQTTWGEGKVLVYYLDPLHFEDFRAELDAGGEFIESEHWTETRDWDKDKTSVRFAEQPDGKLRLEFQDGDNTNITYRYTKVSKTSPRVKLDESLRKYTWPRPQTWDDGENVMVSFLDPLHFEDFRAELNAGGKYYQSGAWTDDNRDWEKGKTFARWVERADGSFELALYKKDNTGVGYRYKKVPQAGDTWDETWDEGTITLTYLGPDNPGFDLRREGSGREEYKGYYTFYYHKEDKTCYVYYPATGRTGVQYSEWLD